MYNVCFQTCYFALLIGKTIQFDFDIGSSFLKQPTSSRRNIRHPQILKRTVSEMRASCRCEWWVVPVVFQCYESQKCGNVI